MLFNNGGLLERVERNAAKGLLTIDLPLYPKDIRNFITLGFPIVPSPVEVEKAMIKVSPYQLACRIDISLGEFAPKNSVLKNIYDVYTDAKAAEAEAEAAENEDKEAEPL